MNQPNLQVISDSLRALAGEVTSLPNLPILTVMESLERTAVLVEQTAKKNNETMAQVELVTQTFSQALCTQEQRMMARSVNATVRDAQATIEPLLKNDGTLPSKFPRNFSEIQGASDDTVRSLLREYGQSTDGDIITCKKRLLGYLGIVVLYI